MEWSAETLREFHRNPEAHPRRAVEFGRTLGGLFTAYHCDEGIFPASVLAERHRDTIAQLPALDPWLEAVLPNWQSLFLFWLIRLRFDARYGPAALGGFDAGADDLFTLYVPVVPQPPSPDPRTPRTLTDWFRQLDGTLVRLRQASWFGGNGEVERLQAFCMVMLTMAPESPMQWDFESPDRGPWNEQLGLHLSWIQPYAIPVGRLRTKELIRHLVEGV